MIGKLDLAVRVSALNMKLTSRQMYVELGSEDGKVYLDLWRMAGKKIAKKAYRPYPKPHTGKRKTLFLVRRQATRAYKEHKVLCLADGLNYREMLAVLRALLLWEEVGE